MEVCLFEFVLTGNKPEADRGDWNNDFAIANYFIDGMGVTYYPDQDMYILNSNTVYDDISKLGEALHEASNKNGLTIFGDIPSADFLVGMLESAYSGDNDQEPVYEKLDEHNADLEFLEGVDDIDAEYSNSFACRCWSLDIEGLEISVNGYVVKESFVSSEYNDHDDYMVEHESEIRKNIAMITTPVIV